MRSHFIETQTGVWFQFADRAGRGLAQADIIVDFPDFVLVCEVKLTQCLAGIEELNGLYRPLAEACFAKPTVGLLICKNLILDPGDRLVDSLYDDRLTRPSTTVWTYQYLP